LTDVVVILVMAPDGESGATIARNLVESGLAACVNRVPGIRSVYRWQGEIHDDAEELLIIKTTAAGVEALTERVLQIHPYEVPEIIALPVVAGSNSYLEWVVSQVGDPE